MNIKKILHLKNAHKPVYSSEHLSWRERIGEDVYVGWVIIVSANFLIAIVLISYAGWLFYLIQSNSITSPQAAVSTGPGAGFDQNGLERVIASFSAKESATSALSRGYNGPADPSQ